MKRRPTVDIGNFLLSLSDAIDLASPSLVQHQQRVAFVAWEMAREARLSEEDTQSLFVAALLHDIGAFSLEEKMAVRRSEEENTEPHCIRGERLLRDVPWLARSAELVRYHHRQWSDWHEPIDVFGVKAAQIIYLADYLERGIDRNEYILHQPQRLVARVSQGSKTLFDSSVVEIFRSVFEREEFWLDLVSPRLYSLLLHDGPYKKLQVDLLGIASLSELFKNMIDFRSRFTATHSSGVAACAALLARMFGLTETEAQLMEIAGHLHDLGKLAIPNTILDKPGGLTAEEFDVVRSHTYFTYMVLSSIAGMEQITEWAAYHHEKLDGSGYPFHCKAEELNSGARIMMVADLFTALVEDRPYRKGMPMEKAVGILKDFSNRGLLDDAVVRLVADNFAQLRTHVNERQDAARKFYEGQFASLAE